MTAQQVIEVVDLPSLAEMDFNAIPRKFKSPTWKTPSRRHKPARAVISDEQKRLQTIITQYQQEQEQRAAAEGADSTQARSTPAPSFNSSYQSIESPPSIRPRKWYCDITGLEGKYKSTRHGLRYYNAEVFGIIQNIAPGVDQQYLELRNANVVLK